MANTIVIPSFIAVVAYFIYRSYFRKNVPQRLPPGPKTLPILGNIMDLPKKGQPEFRHWLKHREAYGPISCVTVLGKTFIILHDQQAAYDLLQKGSAQSSDRPWAEFAFSLCGLSEFMCSRYDSDFRHRRKLFHQQLGTAKLSAEFDDVQEVEGRWFLLSVLNNPDTPIKHLKHAMGSGILKMTYGYSVESEKADPLIELIEEMTTNLVKATVPWLVDFIPALKYLPDGFPGSGFKATARKWKKINQMVVNAPYKFVRRQMAAGNCRQSYVSRLVQECGDGEMEPKLSGHDEAAIKRTAAAMYVGGADTTVTAITTFILAMAKFPEIQRKAQEAIDLLIGCDRLPSLADREKLPYIEALVKEVFRWSPVAPIGIPHAMSEETACGGYLIPKGAVLVPMIWWFLHDPDVYDQPDLFNPARFLEPKNEPDPKTVLFGYGRRVCPGRYFADANVFILIAQILAAFNVKKAVNEHGLEIEPELEHYPGLHSHLKEFPFKIEVRSPKHAALVRLIEVEQPQRKGDSYLLDHDAIKDCLGC